MKTFFKAWLPPHRISTLEKNMNKNLACLLIFPINKPGNQKVRWLAKAKCYLQAE